MGHTINNVIKKNIILTLLYFVAFIMLITGVSYAFFIKEDVNTKNQVINVGSIDASISSSSGVLSITNLIPKEDKDLDVDENIYSFTITNTGEYTLQYEVYLIDNTTNFIDNCANNGGCPGFSLEALDRDKYCYINFKMDNINGNFQDIYSSGKKKISNGIILAGEAQTYRMQIWLSTLAPNEVKGKTASFNILLTATAVDSPIETTSDELSVGDIIKIGDQEFYFLSSYEDTVRMISKYNIRVGLNVGNGFISTIDEKDPLYNRQDSTSIGTSTSNENGYTYTSVINYTDDSHITNQRLCNKENCHNKYQGSVLEEKINNYVNYLRNDLGADVVGDAPTIEDVEKLMQIPNYNMTSFWTKSHVESTDEMVYSTIYDTPKALPTKVLTEYSGVRPILLVDKENIKKKIYLDGNSIKADLSTLKNGKLITGSMISIGSEKFYIISVNNGVVRMIAKDNLNILGNEISQQKSSGDSTDMSFSNELNHDQGKCLDSKGQVSYCYSCYSKSNVEKNNNFYKDFLYQKYNVSVRVDLPNEEDLFTMGYSPVTKTFKHPDYYWAYSTNYWTKIPIDNEFILAIKKNNNAEETLFDSLSIGLRPVVIIHQSQISNLS